MKPFNLGLIVNPMAGIGGPLALKGSDGTAIVEKALHSGAVLRASNRAAEALKLLTTLHDNILVHCYSGSMGEDAAIQAKLPVRLIGKSSTPTAAEDTIKAAQLLKKQHVDLILFAGGDGTARDVYTAVGNDFPVLGIPAGVKMHSGVYAVSPQAAGEIVLRMIKGQLVDIGLNEVRDIDEEAFRQGRVRAKYFGELLVPREGRFLQQVKSSGKEVEELVVQDIGADIVESMDDEALYLIGPGTTPSGIMDELGLDNTLLGIDAIAGGKQIGKDLNETQTLELLEHYPIAYIVITAIGGQGHILGRGNQQLSPAVLKKVGLDNLILVATKTKLSGLAGQPLLVDSNDPELDEALSGYHQVITGYHDTVLYPVGLHTLDSQKSDT